MFKDLTHFSSFIESIIALSFFLSAWKKPEETFNSLLNKSFSNKDILLAEINYLVDILSKFFSQVLRTARWTSVFTIIYGLTILLLSGSCGYSDTSSICQYSIVPNINKSIVFHLSIISAPILLNIVAIVLGFIYYIVAFLGIKVAFLSIKVISILKIRKSNKKKLSNLMSCTEEELKELIKIVKKPQWIQSNN